MIAGKKNFWTVLLSILMIFCCLMCCACDEGDITDQDPTMWPKKGPGAKVPQPEAGYVIQAKTQVDVDGNALVIINMGDFDANDMGDYIRLLLKKKFYETSTQTVVDKYITYTAKKNGLVVSLILNTETDELRVEIY